jgi:hypothetical protein
MMQGGHRVWSARRDRGANGSATIARRGDFDGAHVRGHDGRQSSGARAIESACFRLRSPRRLRQRAIGHCRLARRASRSRSFRSGSSAPPSMLRQAVTQRGMVVAGVEKGTDVVPICRRVLAHAAIEIDPRDRQALCCAGR